MSDVPVPVPPLAALNPTREANSQLIVALAVIAAVTVIGAGLLWVVHLEKDEMLDGAALTAIGTIVGGLIQSLNSPTGVGAIIAQARKAGPP